MPIPPGRYDLGPENATVHLRTRREGLAATVGHDLTIEVTRWAASLDVDDDLGASSVSVTLDLTSLTVVEGHGGALPLTSANITEIENTARKVLRTDRHAEATYLSRGVEGSWNRATVHGTLTVHGLLALHGHSQPVDLTLAETAPGEYRATATVVQTAFGIKPYSAFLGALRVRDEVDVDVTMAFEG